MDNSNNYEDDDDNNDSDISINGSDHVFAAMSLNEFVVMDHVGNFDTRCPSVFLGPMDFSLSLTYTCCVHF